MRGRVGALAGAAMLVAAGSAGAAPDPDPSAPSTSVASPPSADRWSAEANLLSVYVWRGNLFAASRLSPVLQATATWIRPLRGGTRELSLAVFSSVSMRGDHPFEIEPTLAYTWIGEFLVGTLSYTPYFEPASDPPDVLHEVAFSLRRNHAIAPYLLLAIDPIRAKGWYVAGGVSAGATRAGWNGQIRLGVGASTYQGEPTSIQDVTLEGRATHRLRAGAYAGAGATLALAGRTGEAYPVILLLAGLER